VKTQEEKSLNLIFPNSRSAAKIQDFNENEYKQAKQNAVTIPLRRIVTVPPPGNYEKE
jgi:hypothetical protein